MNEFSERQQFRQWWLWAILALTLIFPVIITLNDSEGMIKAFLNVIPDYAEDECTYDLIRKTNDAPGAAMDALVVTLIEYAKDAKKLFINFGMVPLTGMEQPGNTAEKI